MFKSVLLEMMGNEPLKFSAVANQRNVKKCFARCPAAQRFQQLFPDAEHKIVDAEHDFYPDGWRTVQDWLARARVFDRYIVMLTVTVDMHGATAKKSIELKRPELHIFELLKVGRRSRGKGVPKCELNWSTLEHKDWLRITKSKRGFALMAEELISDKPVARFDSYWEATKAGWLSGTKLVAAK